MFIGPESKATLKLRRSGMGCRDVHCAPPELRTLSRNMSYKHLAAMRPGPFYDETYGQDN